MSMKIKIVTSEDGEHTNLFSLPQEVYKYVYEANTISQAFTKGRYIFVVLGYKNDEKTDYCTLRVFILRHMEKIDNMIYSCQLVYEEDLRIRAKAVIQTEIIKSYKFREKVKSTEESVNELCDKVEIALLQWYDLQAK